MYGFVGRVRRLSFLRERGQVDWGVVTVCHNPETFDSLVNEFGELSKGGSGYVKPRFRWTDGSQVDATNLIGKMPEYP